MRFLPPLCFAIGLAAIVAACSSSDGDTDVGKACKTNAECPTGLCNAATGQCLPATAGDGKKDGTETDVDCGGRSASACSDTKACGTAADCKSGVCTSAVCAVPTITDGVRNGDETGTDCGGATAPKCKTGGGCKVDGDCDDVRCDPATMTCGGVTDSDGLKNGDETDADCGGPTTPKKCATGKGCTQTGDCEKALCNATTKVCDPPSHTDAIANGDESDIDCGGSAPKRCIEAQSCKLDADCGDFCSSASKCVTARSCKATLTDADGKTLTAGLATCGTGETTDAKHAHESCCRSLPLPGTPSPARLDKYEVTAGRFRQFVETIGPNVRGWVATEIANNTTTGKQLASDIPVALRNYLPASDGADDPMNLVMQVGGTIMDAREPSMVQGCYNDDGAYGHNTYWLSEAELKKHFAGHPARRWTQNIYDEKSMNCSPYWMYAAFCAWDGGRMPTTAEISTVWPASKTNVTYPWGPSYATTKPVTASDWPVAPAPPSNSLIADDYTNTVNQFNNKYLFYHYPDYGDAADEAGYIASPGRFFRDATAIKSTNESWLDVAANLFEMTKVTTSGSSSFCDFNVFDGDTVDTVNCKHQTGKDKNGNPVYEYGALRGTGLPAVQWIGGSWEVHTIPTSSPVGSTQPAQTQYGKAGVRCARAAL